MNLRLNGNKVRIRISKDELETLLALGKLSATTIFPNSMLRYGIILNEKNEFSITYSDNNISLQVPKALLLEHKDALPSKDGIIGFHPLPDENKLSFSLEIDIFMRDRYC